MSETTKCDKCGQKLPEKPYYPVVDRYGNPIKCEHLMLELSPNLKVEDFGAKVVVEIEPKIILLDAIEWDMFRRVYSLRGRYLRCGEFFSPEYERDGNMDEPVQDLISLGITYVDFCGNELSLISRKNTRY